MFNYKGSNSNARMPHQPRTMINPSTNGNGYSHVFIDDADRMTMEWEYNGGIPTQEMVEKAREASTQRLEAASLSDEMKEHLSSLADSNARIIGNLSSSKSKAAQGAKRQYDAWSRHFGNMEKLDSSYDLSKSRRDHRLADIKETFDYACAHLRVNATRRRTQREQQLEKLVTKASQPVKPKKKRRQKQKATV